MGGLPFLSISTNVQQWGKKVLSANSEANMSVECLMEDEDFHSQIGREELSFGGVAADAAWCSSNWEENNHIYLVANYPLLVSGL